MELARASGHHAAGLLTDLAKACEHVDHGKLAQFAVSTGFPRDALGLCLSADGGPRRFVNHGLCAAWFSVGGQTIIAGCGVATALRKVYTLRLFDALSRWHPHVELHVDVGDVDLCAARASPRQAADRLSGATKLLLQVFDDVLQMQVAFQKCVLLASSSHVDGHLRTNLRSNGRSFAELGGKARGAV